MRLLTFPTKNIVKDNASLIMETSENTSIFEIAISISSQKYQKKKKERKIIPQKLLQLLKKNFHMQS